MKVKQMFSRLFSTADTLESEPAEQLYRSVLQASRTPEFYLKFDVPDSLDGRFDMLCLIMAVLMHRLKSDGDETSARFSQKLYDIFFADMDLTLREMGVGDLGVARRVRQMSEAYMGRLQAYGTALDRKDKDELAAALARNLGRRQQISSVDRDCAAFILASAQKLADIPETDITTDQLDMSAIFTIDG